MFTAKLASKTVAGYKFARTLTVAREGDSIVCAIESHNAKQGLRLQRKTFTLCSAWLAAREAVSFAALLDDDTVRAAIIGELARADAMECVANIF